jgi:hypothetical protein
MDAQILFPSWTSGPQRGGYASELEIDEVPMTKKAIENRGVNTGVIGESAKYR